MSIYRHPDHDAAVAIERRGCVILIDVLARGRSQKRAGGKVVGYTQRNPDRRALVEHLLYWLPAAYPEARAVGAAGGKGAPFEALDSSLTSTLVRASYSAAGNYRWRLWLRTNHPRERHGMGTPVPRVAAAIGLRPDESHRSVTTEWPAELETKR